ncbi:copper chaperone PCu(A)C [Streptomyces sp. RB6PN25]|uniref:Copper chaperone PCu(A)C n=1 Tax=Streptomyces humicola TaxID=2953240 RepID=A0ABT1Q253_9ACTN|nr:copper chaperone PCu(A)C [Streptomyces humicola]MCQ4084013.1 copper chaperone PCu(A)C [Streptomyces humicola]
MSRSYRSGALAAVLALSIAPLAACGAGTDAQTQQVKPDTAMTSADDISIQNAVIVTDPAKAGPAAVTARIFNNGQSAQQLTAVSVPGLSQPVQLTGADGKAGPLTIPAGGTIALGGPGNPSAVVQNSQSVIKDGNVQNVVFTFSKAGQVSLAPTVVPALHYFQGYGPSAPAAPSSPSPSASGKPGTPAGRTGASPSATASPFASASTRP